MRPHFLHQVGVIREFAGVDLGDARRAKRLRRIVTQLDQQPATPFPQALASEADLEGFYRFVRNEQVSFDALLAPHVAATVARVLGVDEALAVHDTSEFRFGGKRAGLGRLMQSGHGFLGHFTQLVSADGRRSPLGTIAVESWTRDEPTPSALRQQKKITYAEMHAMPSEQDRWLRGVTAAENAVAGRVSLIHVMDSEADDYALMAALVEAERRWVIRLCYDRKLADVDAGDPSKAKELVAQCAVACTRDVNVSRRRKQVGPTTRRRGRPRDERIATLAISATPAVFRAPSYIRDNPRLAVNIVSVVERDPPTDAEPVEWLLITTEPIDTDEQILKVIDIYRARWVIEEFFKALKTGCAFEQRQLESKHTILNALGMMLPIAWRLLHLRTLSRTAEDQPGRLVLSELELQVLRHASKKPLPADPTVMDVLLAVARLGGHLRSNGAPGWLVLGRGYQDLMMMVAGFKLAIAAQI
jgi:hypothetical protein